MKVSFRLALITTVASLFVFSQAQAREFADIYTDCGLGAMIAPTNDAVAAVTNVTWDLGTTAISSDSSSPENCKGGQVAAASFVYDAYASLENDLAMGEGQHLAALYQIMGCNSDVQADITSALRSDFSDVVRSGTYSQADQYGKSKELYGMIQDQVAKNFSSSCSV